MPAGSRGTRLSIGTEVPKVAVVGCGAWGKNVARCFAELGALAALVDHHPERANALADLHGARPVPLEAALADPAIAGIAVATQPSTHREIAEAALAANKHLLVEKPLTLDRAGSEILVRDAEARGRVLMVGHIIRFHPAFAALHRLVADGALGRLRRIHASRLNLGAIRAEEDALWCLAPHDVSMILALAGESPVSVAGFDERPLDRAPADAATLRLGFPSGLTAAIQVSWLHPRKEHRLSVVGTEAMAVFDDTAPWGEKVTLYRHRVTPELRIERGEPEPVPVEPGEPLKEECRHFLRCMETGERPLTDGAEALAVVDVLVRAEAAIRSTETERAF
jgi:predicted dehydrogenase